MSHSDPFRYLGPRVENGSSVVRLFLADAPSSTSRSHESDLQRIYDAGLFVWATGRGNTTAGVRATASASSRSRILPLPADLVRVRSLSARRRDPYAPLRKVGRPSDGARWGVGGSLCRFRACGPAGQRGRRLQSLGTTPRQRLLDARSAFHS